MSANLYHAIRTVVLASSYNKKHVLTSTGEAMPPRDPCSDKEQYCPQSYGCMPEWNREMIPTVQGPPHGYKYGQIPLIRYAPFLECHSTVFPTHLSIGVSSWISITPCGPCQPRAALPIVLKTSLIGPGH